MNTSRQPSNFAERVRDARARMELTQAQFAARMAVTPLTVHRWETGQSLPRPLALDRLRELEESEAVQTIAPRLAATPYSPESSVPLDFAGDPATVLLVAEAHRLAHGYQFNAAFASETARIAGLVFCPPGGQREVIAGLAISFSMWQCAGHGDAAGLGFVH